MKAPDLAEASKEVGQVQISRNALEVGVRQEPSGCSIGVVVAFVGAVFMVGWFIGWRRERRGEE